MMTRFNSVIGTEPATWSKPPTAEQIDATGRSLPAGLDITDAQQRLWFGAVVFQKPLTYRAGQWQSGDMSFTSRQVAQAVAAGQQLGVR